MVPDEASSNEASPWTGPTRGCADAEGGRFTKLFKCLAINGRRSGPYPIPSRPAFLAHWFDEVPDR